MTTEILIALGGVIVALVSVIVALGCIPAADPRYAPKPRGAAAPRIGGGIRFEELRKRRSALAKLYLKQKPGKPLSGAAFGDHSQIFDFFTTVGLLLSAGIGYEFVWTSFYYWFVRHWELSEADIQAWRKQEADETYWEECDYLYKQLVRYDAKRRGFPNRRQSPEELKRFKRTIRSGLKISFLYRPDSQKKPALEIFSGRFFSSSNGRIIRTGTGDADDEEHRRESQQHGRLRQDGGQPLPAQDDVEHALHRPGGRQDFDGGLHERAGTAPADTSSRRAGPSPSRA